MSKKLAIRGHATRGKEVIELLEMLGGKNIYKLLGSDRYAYCVIEGCQNEIRVGEYIFGDEDMCFLTLEEFLEKYPFKVGDKVEVCETGKVFTIGNMIWEDEFCIVHYGNMEDIEYYTAKELKPYKEINMNENKCTRCVYAVNNDHCGLRGFRSNFNVNYCSAQNVDKLPNGFELQEDGYFSWVNKKPKYPKTYKECRAILDYTVGCMSGYKSSLLASLQSLLICRDAYWKIAGEDMCLGKPWNPNWTTFEGMPAIFRFRYNIVCDTIKNQHCLLVFPTEEMRDAFYENFKDLIEQCKELL